MYLVHCSYNYYIEVNLHFLRLPLREISQVCGYPQLEFDTIYDMQI